jgi:hypothetical protein
MQYATSLTAIGALSLSLIVAMAAQLSAPEQMLQQPAWPTGMPLMLQLQERHTQPLEVKAPAHAHRNNVHRNNAHQHDAHEHRSPGKPGADVALVSPGIRTLPLGDARELELAIQSHLSQGSLYIRLEPSQDLQLASGVREWHFELNGARTLTLPITVQALAEGQHYIHVFIEHIDEHGIGTTRALATELRTDDGLLTNAYAKSFSAQRYSEYRTLPASETIY